MTQNKKQPAQFNRLNPKLADFDQEHIENLLELQKIITSNSTQDKTPLVLQVMAYISGFLKHNKKEIIEKAKDNGFDFNNITDQYNRNLIHYITQHNEKSQKQMLEFLIEEKLDINHQANNGNTVAFDNLINPQILKICIDNGLDLDIKNKDKKTAQQHFQYINTYINNITNQEYIKQNIDLLKKEKKNKKAK